jgi:S-formylglutathione hydrolase FrmB
VYLPASYNTQPTRRFPTVYLLQGMPGGSRSAFEGALHLEPVMDDGIAAGRLQPMIVVMPPGNRRRFDLATEWANGPAPGTQWDTYLTRDVVAAVDRAFRTVPTAAARGVGGYSAGANGAVNTVVLHHDLFHVGEGWSADLRQTPGLVGRDPTLVRRYSALANVTTVAPLLRRAHASLYLYVGRGDRALANNQRLVAVLRAAGVQVRLDVLGGGHNWRLWHNQLPASLAYFSDHLHP